MLTVITYSVVTVYVVDSHGTCEQQTTELDRVFQGVSES